MHLLAVSARWLFLVAAVVWLYPWLVYPLLLWLTTTVRRHGPDGAAEPVWRPSVEVLIAAHNEGQTIDARLADLRRAQSTSTFDVCVVSDGSTDDTASRARAGDVARLRVLEIVENVGKTAAQNQAIASSTADVIIFTDADTAWGPDAVSELVRPFDDPNVGASAGTIEWTNTDVSAVSSSGGFYTRYELALWKLESPLGLMHCGSGAILAVRRNLLPDLPPTTGEDTLVPILVGAAGYRTVYTPLAVAREARIQSFEAEWRSRLRMTTRGFDGVTRGLRLVMKNRHWGLAWAIVSHKLLRWLSPIFLALALLSAAIDFEWVLARLFLLLSGGAVLLSLLGTTRRCRRLRGVGQLGAFALVNWAFVAAFFAWLRGRRVVRYVSAE